MDLERTVVLAFFVSQVNYFIKVVIQDGGIKWNVHLCGNDLSLFWDRSLVERVFFC